MTDSQHCALVLIAVASLYFLAVAGVSAFRDAIRRGDRFIDLGLILCLDPVDEQFETAITEPTPIGDAALLIVQTETFLKGAS